MRVGSTGCCGVLELVDISTVSTPEEMLQTAWKELKWSHRIPFITFTGVVGTRRISDHASGREDNYGLALADYIRTNNLGDVYEAAPPGRNWTGNMIQMWVWAPNWLALTNKMEPAVTSPMQQ